MKKNDVKIWVKALRSGEYQQCKQALHVNSGEFCCLGVMIDELIDGDWEYDNSRHCWIMDKECKFPSDRILKKLKLTDAAVNLLVDMNDYYNNDFNYIADFIELNSDQLDKESPQWKRL